MKNVKDDRMNNPVKRKETYTRSKIIKNVARSCRTRLSLVEKIYDELENQIMDMLSDANEHKDVCVNLFDGISIKAEHLPERDKLNNLTGERIIAQSAIKIKPKATRNYKEKITAYAKEKASDL